MTIAETIVKSARATIAQFITHEAVMLYKKFGWDEPEEGGEYEIPTGDLGEPIFIKVEVDNSYLDVEESTYEYVEVAAIIVNPEEGIWVVNEDGNDWTIDELSVEEIERIASVMERAYNRK